MFIFLPVLHENGLLRTMTCIYYDSKACQIQKIQTAAKSLLKKHVPLWGHTFIYLWRKGMEVHNCIYIWLTRPGLNLKNISPCQQSLVAHRSRWKWKSQGVWQQMCLSKCIWLQGYSSVLYLGPFFFLLLTTLVVTLQQLSIFEYRNKKQVKKKLYSNVKAYDRKSLGRRQLSQKEKKIIISFLIINR